MHRPAGLMVKASVSGVNLLAEDSGFESQVGRFLACLGVFLSLYFVSDKFRPGDAWVDGCPQP